MRRRSFLFGAAGLAACAARAKQTRWALGGDVFMDGGTEVRLADILSPRLETLRGGPETHAEAARDSLQELLAGISSLVEAAPTDRWGRQVAHIFAGDGVSLQEKLVLSGAARVRPESANHRFIKALFGAEAEARRHKRGLWRYAVYRIRDAADARDAIGSFNLVEGVVVAAARNGGRIYLNFDEDFRTDFTASVSSTSARRWKKTIDLETLASARLRIRGHVAWINGPSIEIGHPLAVEVLEELGAGLSGDDPPAEGIIISRERTGPL